LSCVGADEPVDEAFLSGFQGRNHTKSCFVAGLQIGRYDQRHTSRLQTYYLLGAAGFKMGGYIRNFYN
jgi:hypothetical protein